LGIRQNPLLALIINFVVPWDLYWTIRFDRARRRVVNSLPAWLAALAELEAFVALAEWNSAHGQAWPVFIDAAREDVLLEAKSLAHPLLSPKKRIANDLLISKNSRNHLITGSNMSGKSTFLRAIGINLLLAHAGAKVTATSLRLIPLRVESSMRPADSLADGFSSFYSEVSDLVEIVKLAQVETAVFYLIDEIFRGTNNRERRIGAEAVIRALAQTTAMGFVTTHDLDLAALEGAVASLENHHFRDDVTDGVMTFSYEYRSGPCPSTNALKVMRAAGLPVPN
jgi:DNA mismatch repair ATPase MutS